MSPKEKRRLIDCDVHQSPGNDLKERLPHPWRNMSGPSGMSWPALAIGHSVLRRDAVPPNHSTPGYDRDFLIQDLLERYAIDYAVLTGGGNLTANVHSNSHFAVAYARAYNDWLIEKWLSYDERFKGSMMVAPQDIGASVKEIERIGSHPNVVQIVMASASPILYGKPQFWPLYEAAAAHNLPVAIHPGTEGKGQTVPTASGYPSTYIEWHTMLATGYMNHLTSLVCEGVFEKFPNFRFVLIEGGVSWVAPFMWRLDKNWKGLRAEVPWLTLQPSEYVKRNVRFTTQPLEEPENKDLLLEIFAEIDAAHTVMFSTDYPHWDFDSPDEAFRGFPQDLRDRIFFQTARELYGLS